MWFFSKRLKSLSSEFLKGFTDYHSHILPGVDDGIKSLNETHEVLRYYENMGVKKVIFTPHINHDTYTDFELVQSTFNNVRLQYQGGLQLSLSAEYMLDNGYLRRLEAGLSPLEGDGVLLETSYLNKPQNFDEMLYETVLQGYSPVLAHPERYVYMNSKSYEKLKNRDYLFQLNLLSLSGFYGSQVQKKTLALLEQGMYDIVGSDLHRLERFQRGFSQIKLSDLHYEKLWQLVHKKRGL